jgi:hypothetical protein
MVKASCGVGVFRPERLFTDFQRALKERFRLRIVAAVAVKVP